MNLLIEAGIKLLSERNCSLYELRWQLEKDFADMPQLYVVVEEALARLIELNLVNDKRLAENLARRYSHKGDRYISHVLQQKGVADDIISGALVCLDSEYIRAMDEVRKKGGCKPLESIEKAQNRLSRFLSGRGFAPETIEFVVGEFLGEKVTCIEE